MIKAGSRVRSTINNEEGTVTYVSQYTADLDVLWDDEYAFTMTQMWAVEEIEDKPAGPAVGSYEYCLESARIMAQVTGSIGATYTHENADGTSVTATWNRS